MAKTLVIVESPNKIKSISKYLGPDYLVKASVGHVMDLATGDKKLRLGVDIENKFTPKYVISPDKKDVVQDIINSAEKVKNILLATNDREGEAIGWHLKSCLESSGKPIKRVKFNEITKAAIQKAIQNPEDLDADLFDAQQARRVVDRIVGFLASDFLRNAMGPNLSAGRVQSVAARLIVERDQEIEAFKPEEYWNISATLAKTIDPFTAKYTGKVPNKEKADKIKADLDKDTYIVESVERKEKNRNPYPPLTTSKLQQAASGRYGFPVKKTMQVAQALYEAGLITYMRTDSVRISPEAITSVRDYLKQNKLSLPKNPNYYKSKDSAQDAHEAIRPSDVFSKPADLNLDSDQAKLYKLIWERFVACQMEPAVYDTMAVVIKSSSGHELKANGRSLKYEGWLSIAGDLKKEDGTDEMLPPLKEKDKLILVDPKVVAEQKFTQPPGRYGEASLVAELEKRGIGRPSTYATIIETIKGRGYVELQNKTYHATDIGKKVIETLKNNFSFMDYQYTANMEEKLDLIEHGKLGYVDALTEFYGPFKKECEKGSGTGEDLGFVCPICNDKTVLKHGPYGFYCACVKRPKCKGTIPLDKIDDKWVVKPRKDKQVEPGVNCPKCGSGMYFKEGQYGPFYYCSQYPKCKGTQKKPYGKKCSDCGSDLFITVFSGQRKLGCMGYSLCGCKHIEELPEAEKKVDGWTAPKKKFTKKKFNKKASKNKTSKDWS